MVLTLMSHGCRLSVEGKCFVAQGPDNRQILQSSAITEIIAGPWASLTTPAILLCAERGIPLHIENRFGEPAAALQSFSQGTLSDVKRGQLLLHGSAAQLANARDWVAEKLQNRIRQLHTIQQKRFLQGTGRLRQAGAVRNAVAVGRRRGFAALPAGGAGSNPKYVDSGRKNFMGADFVPVGCLRSVVQQMRFGKDMVKNVAILYIAIAKWHGYNSFMDILPILCRPMVNCQNSLWSRMQAAGRQ